MANNDTQPETPKQGRKKSDGLVKVRITKFGDGKVSSGQHEAGSGDKMLPAGTELEVTAANAADLEALGFAEAI